MPGLYRLYLNRIKSLELPLMPGQYLRASAVTQPGTSDKNLYKDDTEPSQLAFLPVCSLTSRIRIFKLR